MTYNRTRCITELRALATAAAQWEIRRDSLFKFAEPSIKLRLQSYDALDAVELLDFVYAARWVADGLEREVTVAS